MPLRSVKMKRFIFGFQRRVWCPKWTPLSSSCFMLTTAMWRRLSVCARRPGAGPRFSVVAGTGWCAALASSGATPPAVARRDRGGDCPAWSAGRGRAKSTRRRRAAPDSIRDRRDGGSSPGRAPSTDRRRSARPARRDRADRSPRAHRVLAVLLILVAAVLVPGTATAAPAGARRPAGRRCGRLAAGGQPAVTRPFEAPAHAVRPPGTAGSDLRRCPGRRRCSPRATAWSRSPGWWPAGRW